MCRRSKFRQGLSTLYLPFYDELCERLPMEWNPYSGLRTFDEQTALWNQGRITKGSIVTNAKAGESAHNYGCASDWTIWENDNPIWMHKDDPRWAVYFSAIDKAALKKGSDFGDTDHNEVLIACDWPHILIAFNVGGMVAAQQKIEEEMKLCQQQNYSGLNSSFT